MSQPPPINYASLGFQPQTPKPKTGRHLVGWLLFVGLAIMFFMLMRQSRSPNSNLSFSDFSYELNSGNVTSIVVAPDEVRFSVRKPLAINSYPGGTGLTGSVRLPQDMGKDFRFVQWLMQDRPNAAAPDIRFESDQNLAVNLLLPLIPWLLIFGFIYFFVFRTLRNARNPQWQKPMPVVIVNPDSLPPNP